MIGSHSHRSAGAARLALLALTAVAAIGASGCSGGGDAHAQSRKGSQPTAWGAPYANMPDIVPPNVREDAYTPLTAEQAGPAIDPAKGFRTEALGGGVYMATKDKDRSNNYNNNQNNQQNSPPPPPCDPNDPCRK